MSTRILHVVANVDAVAAAGPDALADAVADAPGDARPAPGTWLTHLADAWRVLEAAGFEQLLVSPAGGEVAVDDADPGARAWSADPIRGALLAHTAAPAQIDAGDFDALICVASDAGAAAAVAHASPGLERIARSIATHGGVVAAIGHPDCALTASADAARAITGARAATVADDAARDGAAIAAAVADALAR